MLAAEQDDMRIGGELGLVWANTSPASCGVVCAPIIRWTRLLSLAPPCTCDLMDQQVGAGAMLDDIGDVKRVSEETPRRARRIRNDSHSRA